MHAALDWSNDQPLMTPDLAVQLRDLGIARILAQTQFPDTFQACASSAMAAQIGLDAVRFLYNPGSAMGGDGSSYVDQTAQAVAQIQAVVPAVTRYLDLDFEDDTGDTSQMAAQLNLSIAYANSCGVKVRIYTRPLFWQTYIPDGIAGLIFRMALYDGLAALRGYNAVQYSGGIDVLGITVNPNVCDDTDL